MGRKSKEFLIFLGPSFIIMGALLIYPQLYCLKNSFYYYYLPSPPAKFIGLNNYIMLFQDRVFLRALVFTGCITAMSVALEFLSGFSIALLFDRITKGKSVLLKFIMLPMMVPPVVVGLIMKWMFLKDWGMVNYFLSILGISGPAWLTQFPLSLIAITWAEAWQWTPFTILVLYAGLQNLPREPMEAAAIDGASSWQKFRYVTFPSLMPLVTFVIIIRSMDVFRLFDKVFVMTGGGPGIQTQTITLYNYKLTFDNFQIGRGSAMAVLTALILAVGIGLHVHLTFKREGLY